MKLEAAREHIHVSLDALRAMQGREAGVSDWLQVTQPMVDAFADLCGDHQFIHVDPARARRESPYGGTVAHGFLTLGLLSAMAYDALPGFRGLRAGINYGFDRIRFLAPVPAGARLRARFRLLAVEERQPSELTLSYEVTVEIDGAATPALVAVWLSRALLAQET